MMNIAAVRERIGKLKGFMWTGNLEDMLTRMLSDLDKVEAMERQEAEKEYFRILTVVETVEAVAKRNPELARRIDRMRKGRIEKAPKRTDEEIKKSRAERRKACMAILNRPSELTGDEIVEIGVAVQKKKRRAMDAVAGIIPKEDGITTGILKGIIKSKGENGGGGIKF